MVALARKLRQWRLIASLGLSRSFAVSPARRYALAKLPRAGRLGTTTDPADRSIARGGRNGPKTRRHLEQQFLVVGKWATRSVEQRVGT